MCVCATLISAHTKGLTHGVSSCSIWLISVVISAFQKARALKETKKKGVEYRVATSWEDPMVPADWEDDGSTHCSILSPVATSTDNILRPKMQENHCGWVG